jgi:hypothetical protein
MGGMMLFIPLLYCLFFGYIVKGRILRNFPDQLSGGEHVSYLLQRAEF